MLLAEQRLFSRVGQQGNGFHLLALGHHFLVGIAAEAVLQPRRAVGGHLQRVVALGVGAGAPAAVLVNHRGAHERRPVLVEILNYERDQTPFRNAVLVAPVFDADGELEYFLGSQVELPDDAVGPLSARHASSVALVKTLSPRQRQILERIAAGHRSKQIAWQLDLSEKTVKMHRSLLLHKLGTTNVADAIRIAVEAGL